MGWYRIDPKDVEEAIKIHKILMTHYAVVANEHAVNNLYKVIDSFITLLEGFNPEQAQKLKQDCLKLTMQVNECINDFIDTELSNLDELHKYATIIISLTGVLKAYEVIFGARLKKGLMEVLNSLGAIPISDLKQEEGDEDAET